MKSRGMEHAQEGVNKALSIIPDKHGSESDHGRQLHEAIVSGSCTRAVLHLSLYKE